MDYRQPFNGLKVALQGSLLFFALQMLWEWVTSNHSCILGAGIAIPGSPYRGQNWKIGKMTFVGSKNALLGVPLKTI